MHYYPIVFNKLYPMAPTILNLYRQCTNNKIVTFFDIPPVEEEVSYWEPLYKLAVQCNDDEIDSGWKIIAWFNQVTNWTMWCAWYLGGALIFSLQPEITSEFLDTDVEGLKIKDIKMPSEQIYLHWGVNELLGKIDGCFIFKIDNDLYFCPTSYDSEIDYEKPVNWLHQPQMTVDYKLSGEWDIDYESIYEEMNQRIEEWKDKSFFTNSVEPGCAAIITNFMANHYSNFQQYLLPIIRLLVNALLYLTSAPEDVIPEWDGVPEELTKKWESTPPFKRKRATQELNKLGYRRINFVGRKLTYPCASRQSTSDSVKLVMHRRRGHIRHQPCGKGRQERKLKWIRPTWINKSEDGIVTPRVYDVEKS